MRSLYDTKSVKNKFLGGIEKIGQPIYFFHFYLAHPVYLKQYTETC